MVMKYALYPGCAAKGATPELYQSTMAIIGRLGIEVTELTASSCCGAGVVAEADPDGALALNARTFAQAEQLGLDVMTICRSEEHTSELQSRGHIVCRLLLEKKKTSTETPAPDIIQTTEHTES